VYEKIKERMKTVNEKAGFKKYRSVSHFVENCVMSYVPPKKEEK
jgi:hypothetical protein